MKKYSQMHISVVGFESQHALLKGSQGDQPAAVSDVTVEDYQNGFDSPFMNLSFDD